MIMENLNKAQNPSKNKKRQAPRADFHDYTAPGYYLMKNSIDILHTAARRLQRERSRYLQLYIKLKKTSFGKPLIQDVV